MAALPNHSIDKIVARCEPVLAGIVNLDIYDYAPCYLWYDSPLYDSFGDVIGRLRGDTIYLDRESATPVRDLFHELGHVVGRKCDLVGHVENGFRGGWDQSNRRLIAQVCARKHWSSYLNLLALARDDFVANAGSEIWAELFMIWHLHPDCEEARLLDAPMRALRDHPVCRAIEDLVNELGFARGPRDTAARSGS